MAGKSDLAERIAARGWSKTTASSAVDAVLDEITAALAAGERVTLTGFGTFETAGRAARTARNPQTGATIDVPATTVARFHPGATLRSRVAASEIVPLAPLSAPPVGALAPKAETSAAAKAPVVSTPRTRALAPAKPATPAKDAKPAKAAAKAKSATKSKPEPKKASAKKVSKAEAAVVAAPGKKKASAKQASKNKKKK